MNGDDMDANYWVDNLRGTVQFASVIESLLQSGHNVFIEVSPHPVLMNAINENAQHLSSTVLTIPSLLREKPEQDTLYKNLGDLFAGGFNMPWDTFHKITKAPDIAIPSYPFQRERYEIEDKSAELDTSRKNCKFPLLGKNIPLADAENTFFWETQLSVDLFPYMKDHQVNETAVLPGVAYLEMVLEASSDIYTHGIPVVSDLKFIKAVTLTKEISTLQLKISQENPTSSSFRFFQKSVNESGKTIWTIVAEGNLQSKPRHHLKDTVHMPAKPAFENNLPAGEYYESLKALGLQYGKSFQRIKELAKSKLPLNEVHFTLEIDEQLKSTYAKYKIHPALLDSFLQPLFYDVLQQVDKKSGCTTFLSEISEISFADNTDFTGNLKGVATLYPLKKDEQKGLIHTEADILICKEDGSVVLKVKGVKGKVIDSALIEKQREKLNKWLYKINWVKQTEPNTQEIPAAKGSWVVLGDPYGISDLLVSKLKESGSPTIHVAPAAAFEAQDENNYTINYGNEEDYGKLMDHIFRKDARIEGIIHAASMSYNWIDPPLTADAVEEQQIFGSISFMYLHQRLASLKLFEMPKLVIITNGIQTVGVETDIAQPVHSPLWGMAKVMFNELTQYNCRYFDLSANPSMEELDLLVMNIRHPLAFENEVVFRGQDTYMPRLNVHQQEDEFQEEAKKRQFSTEGTYLVTGFKGLGFYFIEWMIRQGARSFALVSRSGEASAEVLEKIDYYESQGCQFKILCADTGNYDDLKTVIDFIDASMPPLKGVVHAAGVIEAKTLTDMNQEEFLRILNPKVKGAWNLHLLTQNKPLDCFIMFSSASTLIGLSGQGSYVAANAFLDTLAQSRKRMGLAGMSINWGVIKDVGMVANEGDLEKYARAEGFEPVNMRDAMEVFNTIYDSEHTQIGIVKLHAESMATYYSALAKTRYFKGLLTKENNGDTIEKSFLSVYNKLQNPEEKISAIELLVSQHVSKIVKTPVSRIKSTMTFKGMGIDSLMAIQLRNLLEKSLDLKLSVAIFWTYPSIREYSAFLVSTLAETAVAIAGSPKEVEWFVRPEVTEKAVCRLFCFHDAGGSSSLFEPIRKMLPDSIELISIELPGRGHREGEMMYTELKPLINDLLPQLEKLTDKPFAFFGHSMGGLIAFEMARELTKQNKKLPLNLFISSTPGLTTYHKREVDHKMNDAELFTMFPHLLKIADLELQQVLLKMLRSDLHLLNNYSYTAGDPLSVPIVAVHGNDDLRVSLKQMEKWKDETASRFSLVSRPGGHRYIENDTQFISELIKEKIGSNLNPSYIL
jgi:surfactin synthase thioesterase subunit/acyl transferase domain-containing protein/acyl carrier protein